MPIDKSQALSLILEKESLIVSQARVQPHDYQSLKQLSIQLELAEEITALKEMVAGADFEVRFLRRCKERALKINDTCLSFPSLPEGVVNKLYWDIAMLSRPRTMGDTLKILMPDVTKAVIPNFELKREVPTAPLSMKDVHVRFIVKNPDVADESPSPDVLSEPPSLARLGDLVVSGQRFLDTVDVASLNFVLHRTFHAALVKFDPTMAGRLYQHNPALRRLSDQLSMLQGQGQNPLEAITNLIRELRFGGSRITGSWFAANDAQLAFAAFLGYLEALPVAIRSQLMSLTCGITTLESVINHLRKGHCVETASANLQRIIEQSANCTFLMTRPTLTRDYLKSIAMEYSDKSLPTKAMDNISTLPNAFLANILSRIEINNAYDYVSLLLAFPPELYSSLLQHARIGASEDLPIALAERINEGVLSKEQKQTFFAAIFVNYQRFSILKIMTFHWAAGGALDDRRRFFNNLPLEAQFRGLKEKDSSGNTILHLAAANSILLSTYLGLFPEQGRFKALKQKNAKGETVLHCAIGSPESVRIIFSLLPASAHLNTLKQKDKDGNSILHKATSNPESLRILLALLTERQRLAAVEQENEKGHTVLVTAVSNVASFRMIFESYPESKRCALVKNTFLLYRAASNSECLYILLKLNPEKDRLKLITQCEDYDTPVLYAIFSNPEAIVSVLRLLPERDRLTVLKTKYGNDSLFHTIVKSTPSKLEEVFQLIPKETLRNFIRTSDSELHLAAFHPEALAKILTLYDSKKAKLEAVKQKTPDGSTVLSYAKSNPISLRMILELYDLEERFIAVTESGRSDSLIARAAFHPQSLNVIFDLLPVEKHFDAIKATDGTGYDVLESAAYHAESLEKILALYPASERLKAACRVTQTAVNQSTLPSLLKLLSKPERLELVKSKKLLHSIGKNTALLHEFLSLYPAEERLAALNERDREGNTVLYKARFHPETLRAILLYYPEEERFVALKARNGDHTVLNNLHHFPKSLSVIMPLLPPTERLQFAVIAAQNAYEEWYKQDQNVTTTLRGDVGFFSWMRHGSFGQARAKKLMSDITSATDENTIIQQLKNFLADDKTRWNQHSFVCFLLDELAKVGGLWTGLRSVSIVERDYNKSMVNSVLNGRLTGSIPHGIAP